MNIPRCKRLLSAPLWSVLFTMALSTCSSALEEMDIANILTQYWALTVPRVTSLSPTDGSSDMSLSSSISATFDRAMSSSTITVQSQDGSCSGSFQVSSDSFATCIGGSVSASSDSFSYTFTPSANLSLNTVYHVLITKTAQDETLNPITINYQTSSGITTIAAPEVTSLYAVAGTSSIPLYASMRAVFDKTMDSGTLTAPVSLMSCAGYSVLVSQDGFTTCHPLSITYDSDNLGITMTPTSAMSEGGTYQMRITTDAKSQAGISLGTVSNASVSVFSPSSISGLGFWLKANGGVYSDAGATLAVDTNTVQQWNDWSGNGQNADQATAGDRPTYRTGMVNGLPSLLFDGANSFMNLSAFFLDPSTTDFTIIIAFKAQGASEDNIVAQLNGTGIGRVHLGRRLTSDRMFTIPTTASYTLATSTRPDNVWDIYSFTWNRTSLDNSFFALGVADGVANVNRSTCDGAWLIGENRVGAAQFQGELAELIVYSSDLSTTNRNRVECYLYRKYAIALDGSITCP